VSKKQEKIALHLELASECLKRAQHYSEQITNIGLALATVKVQAREHMQAAKKMQE